MNFFVYLLKLFDDLSISCSLDDKIKNIEMVVFTQKNLKQNGKNFSFEEDQ
jgi:hypothetical protein